MAVPTKPGDVQFASILSGAYGSAAIALFFLIVDSIQGQALYTPSFMGQVVLFGTAPAEVTSIRLDALALYSLLHLAAFIGIGTAVSVTYARLNVIPRNPFAVMVVLLAALTFGTVAVDRVLFPGIIEGIGSLPLALGNGFTAITMALLVYQTFEGSIWSAEGGHGTAAPEASAS